MLTRIVSPGCGVLGISDAILILDMHKLRIYFYMLKYLFCSQFIHQTTKRMASIDF